MPSNCTMEFHSEQRKKLGSILNFDECERTYDDLHPKVVINGEKSKGFHQKEQVERKSRESGELIMYMSCLPSYLESGETPQDKPFNVGVLDWRKLQNWQHNSNGIAGINSEHSSSTSNSISSKGSSSYSSSDNTWPHHGQKIKYPSPPTEGCSSGSKLVARSGREFLDCNNGSIDLSKVHHSSLQATQCSDLNAVNGLTVGKSKDRGLQKVTGTRSKPLETDGIISCSKGNDMIQKAEASKTKEQVPSSAVIYHDSSKSHKTAVPESRNDTVHHQSDSCKGDNNRSLDENRFTFYGGCREKACQTKSRPDHTRFYSVASERVKTKESQVEKSFTKEIRSLNCPSSKEQTMQISESVSTSLPGRKNLEKKKNSGSKPVNLAENKNIQMKVEVSESTKVRNPSPIRRFSFAMGRFGKSVNPNTLVSENIPDSKVMSALACSNYSTTDKSNGTTRARSSPLRRLLDPILKPKGVDSHDCARSSERNPSTTGRTLESSSGRIEFPVLRSVKGTSEVKHGASSVQALLQVVVKNGLPLFTFTVDNCSDILAATVKELNSNKTTRRWIYTFLSFSKMKKNSGGQRRNQGSKDKNQGYMSNGIAQMMVSDILNTDSTGKGYVRREFVLSSVGTRDANQTSDSFPGDELAAIIVTFPERNSSISEDDEGNESASGDLFSTTVILPGGHHGAPRKGEPSPLIERWRNGGSCDCGGWDLGCQMRTLTNDRQLNQQSNSMKSQTTVLKLFSQEEVEEERAMWMLSAFEDGIFSAEFNSSLKLVQAFSIGIAALHSRTSVVSSSNTFEETTESENVSKIFSQAEVEVSAKYAAHPPLSPVGRV